MQLNEFGRIAHDEWVVLKSRYPHLNFDVFQIMPNHMHGIVVVGPTLAVVPTLDHDSLLDHDPGIKIQKNDYVDFDHPEDDGTTARVVRADLADHADHADEEDRNISLSDAMGAYKSIVFVKCLEIFKSRDERMGKFWQRSFDDKIIRSENSLQNIANYIVNNPKKWGEKKF